MKIIKNNETMSRINRDNVMGIMPITMKSAFDDHDKLTSLLDDTLKANEDTVNKFIKNFET